MKLLEEYGESICSGIERTPRYTKSRALHRMFPLHKMSIFICIFISIVAISRKYLGEYKNLERTI